MSVAEVIDRDIEIDREFYVHCNLHLRHMWPHLRFANWSLFPPPNTSVTRSVVSTAQSIIKQKSFGKTNP